MTSFRIWAALWLCCAEIAGAQAAERLGRGLVGIHSGEGAIFLSWRLLAEDPPETAFNVYRAIDGARPMKVNAEPLRKVTWFAETNLLDRAVAYHVRPIVGRREGKPSEPVRFEAGAPTRPYLAIPLQLPEGYAAGDASIGDLDGDGELDFVLKSEQRPRDTASLGLTGETLLQGYHRGGKLLWTINMGRNIREGAHYTQFIVYDLDGDGIAEIACKTADGTRDGTGKVIGDAQADWRDTNSSSRTFGRILQGPEYFTIFSGETGAALATTNYVPPRGDIGGWGGIGGNGGNDNVGNRVDRFLAGVAYLDGKNPSVVMCRGYYGRSVLAAWDWRKGKLSLRWVFDSKDASNKFSGQGGHALSVADVDGDGRDEIVYHAMVVDDDGTGLFSTGFRHGDAMHVGDLDPLRPGLEVFTVHENEDRTAELRTPGMACYDARTGETIWSDLPGVDIPAGLSADIDPRYPGNEMWARGGRGLRTSKGDRIGHEPRTANFAIWWDGDLLRELLDRNRIFKWNWETETLDTIFVAEGAESVNGGKATPCLSGDLFGDWREEAVFRTPDSKELRIYTSTIPTETRMPSLLQDRQYRAALAWQNVAYNQPPHPSFYIGPAMQLPARK